MELLKEKGLMYDKNMEILKNNNINKSLFKEFMKNQGFNFHDDKITPELIQQFKNYYNNEKNNSKKPENKELEESKKDSYFNLTLFDEILVWTIIVSVVFYFIL